MRNLGFTAVEWVVLCLAGGLAGCGSTGVTPLATSELKGNWLITGDMPAFVPAVQHFSVAATLDVIDNQVYASVTDFYPCTAGGAGGSGNFSPAPISTDGSFTLQTSQLSGVTPTIVITINGSVPKGTTTAWTGTYLATNANAGCTPVMGSFTAVPILPATGTFTGTGSMGPQNTNLVISVPQDTSLVTSETIAVTLQQGGPTSLDPPQGHSQVNSVNALTGTISVKGSPCFSSGTSSDQSGLVIGDMTVLSFKMDDGSQLFLHGALTDPSASTLEVSSVLVMGGQCDSWAGFFQSNLTRQ
jgi:hypothetical protein